MVMARVLWPRRAAMASRLMPRLIAWVASVCLWSVSLDELVCPFLPICDPIVRGKVVKVDDSHLTPDVARSLVPALAEYFRTNGILP